MKNKPNYPYYQIPLFTVVQLQELDDEALALYSATLTENTLYWSVAQGLNRSHEMEDSELTRWDEEKDALKSAIMEMGARYMTIVAGASKDTHPDIYESLTRMHANGLRILQEFGPNTLGQTESPAA